MKRIITIILALLLLCPAGVPETREAAPARGDIVSFGSYEQDNDPSNGAEPIEWIVVDTDGASAVLLSRFGLDTIRYNEEQTEVTWETCTLRRWLNGAFLDAAFSADEQARLLTAQVPAEVNPEYETVSGNDTDDRVYLAGFAETGLLPRSALRCEPTEYAKAQGAFLYPEGTCGWWLRSRGANRNMAACVNGEGRVDHSGGSVEIYNRVVRPMIAVALP